MTTLNFTLEHWHRCAIFLIHCCDIPLSSSAYRLTAYLISDCLYPSFLPHYTVAVVARCENCSCLVQLRFFVIRPVHTRLNHSIQSFCASVCLILLIMSIMCSKSGFTTNSFFFFFFQLHAHSCSCSFLWISSFVRRRVKTWLLPRKSQTKACVIWQSLSKSVSFSPHAMEYLHLSSELSISAFHIWVDYLFTHSHHATFSKISGLF